MEQILGQIVLWAGLAFTAIAMPLQIYETWKCKVRGPSIHLIAIPLVIFSSRAAYTLLRREYVITIPDVVAIAMTIIMLLQWLKYPSPSAVSSPSLSSNSGEAGRKPARLS